MVSRVHPIHGLLEASTETDWIALAKYYDETSAKARNVRAFSTKGTVKQGSAHDTWNKATDTVKASIVRAYVEDNALDYKRVNRYTLPFLNSIKPARTSFVQWLQGNESKLPIDDSLLIELVKEYEKTIESWNESRLASIVRSYNVSRRAMVVNENVSESKAIV